MALRRGSRAWGEFIHISADSSTYRCLKHRNIGRECEDELKGGKMVFVLILMRKVPGGRQRRVFNK